MFAEVEVLIEARRHFCNERRQHSAPGYGPTAAIGRERSDTDSIAGSDGSLVLDHLGNPLTRVVLASHEVCSAIGQQQNLEAPFPSAAYL